MGRRATSHCLDDSQTLCLSNCPGWLLCGARDKPPYTKHAVFSKRNNALRRNVGDGGGSENSRCGQGEQRDEARPHSAVIDFVTVVVTALSRALENQQMAAFPVDK